MISNLEDDFIAVRVQDPRIQNEGSWNSFVDYKIFLHTNSKAFTAKTSCVRRRYSEFVWLKKQLQRNAGLVPVPALPTKSFFYFNNEDFLEGRRKGLQAFLEKVVHMTVCLSDSQLHLFLQTQLPVGHIQDCVQGHTPYSVTDSILDYASSNQGFAQAQENDPIKESSLTISYESMESPVPHQPCQPNIGLFSCELTPCTDSDPLEGLLQPNVIQAMVELQHKEKSSRSVLQKNNHLEAMVEECGETGVSFFLGDDQDGPERLTLAEQTRQMSSQIQAPIEVHWTGTGFEENCDLEEGSLREESVTVDTEEKTATDSDTEEHHDHHGSSEEANSVDILDFKYRDAGSQEDVLEDDGTENQVLENHACCDVNGLEHVADVSCLEEVKKSDGGTESQSLVNTLIESDIQEENHCAHSVPQLESSDDDTQPGQEVDLVGPNEDRHSLVSSNESIIKVSDEESICDEAEDLIQDENHYMKTLHEEIHLWSDVDDSSRNILDLHLKGCCEEVDGISTQEEVQQAEELQTNTSITDLSQSVDLNSTVIGGDQTENSDFSIIETRYLPGNS